MSFKFERNNKWLSLFTKPRGPSDRNIPEKRLIFNGRTQLQQAAQLQRAAHFPHPGCGKRAPENFIFTSYRYSVMVNLAKLFAIPLNNE